MNIFVSTIYLSTIIPVTKIYSAYPATSRMSDECNFSVLGQIIIVWLYKIPRGSTILIFLGLACRKSKDPKPDCNPPTVLNRKKASNIML
jgi:hypothetical protein